MCALDYSSIDIAVYLSQKSIFGIVIMDHNKYYSIGGNNSENSNDMRSRVH